MNKWIILTLFTLCSSLLFSQRNCGTMDYMQQLQNENPEIMQQRQSIEEFTQRWLASDQGATQKSGSVVYTIPTVVHIVYNTSAENISDADVQSQIDVLNEDFRAMNADITSVVSAFTGITADTEIEFCLATIDPNGNATTGITRTSTSVTSFSTSNNVKFNSSGGKDAWPAADYLNVWVCDLGSGLLGYAQFPGGPASTDGVVNDYAYFGRLSALSPYDLGRTATHEVGHWLNLYHTFQGGCGSNCATTGDLVCDTPPVDAPNFGCPLSSTSCGNLDNVQNYMDYSDDACLVMFTQGQSDRMRATFAPGGSRNSLLSSLGCTGTPIEPTCDDGIQNGMETGVDCGGPDCPVCPPELCFSTCASQGNTTADEWIQTITVGGLLNNSGDNGGYAVFPSVSSSYERNSNYTVSLTPGFSGTLYNEWWRIWIDYNQDGDFTDAGELAFDSGSSSSSTVTGSFTVPSSATLGDLTMRVQMKYSSSSSSCEVFTFGEVEDYCITITDGSACNATVAPDGLSSVVTASGVDLSWNAVPGSIGCQVQARPSGTTGFASLSPILGTEVTAAFIPSSFLSPGNYDWKVRCACSLGPVVATPFSALANFTWSSLRSSKDNFKLSVSPNPFSDYLLIEKPDFIKENLVVKLYNATGQLMMTRTISGTGVEKVSVPQNMPDGLYLLSVEGFDRLESLPLVKSN